MKTRIRLAAVVLMIAATAVLAAGCKQLSFGEPKWLPDVSGGGSALKQHDLAKATAQFDQAIRKDPHNPMVYVEVMHACLKSSQLDLMRTYFQKGIEALKGSKREDRA